MSPTYFLGNHNRHRKLNELGKILFFHIAITTGYVLSIEEPAYCVRINLWLLRRYTALLEIHSRPSFTGPV